MKLVIELKTGFDPNVVLDLLYRFTPLEESFSINNVALVEGRPETLGLRDLLGVYLAHRVNVTKRRSENRLGKKLARLHLVEGLLKAIVSKIDEVIRLSEQQMSENGSPKNLCKMSLFLSTGRIYLEIKLRRLTSSRNWSLKERVKLLLVK